MDASWVFSSLIENWCGGSRSEEKQTDLDQLSCIADALFLDLIFELSPNKPLSNILKERARKKRKNYRYAQGKMSLEAQEPSVHWATP